MNCLECFENIIKLKNINTNEMSDDVIRMLKHERMSNEQLNLDDTILLIYHVHAPFRKA